MPYPCVGYCIIDKRGYCVACGRPPTLGAPENCAVGPADKAREDPSGSPDGADGKAQKPTLR